MLEGACHEGGALRVQNLTLHPCLVLVRMGLLSRLACTSIPLDLTHILSYYFYYKSKCVQGSEESVVKLDETGSVPGTIPVCSVAYIQEVHQTEKTHKANPFSIDRKCHQLKFLTCHIVSG